MAAVALAAVAAVSLALAASGPTTTISSAPSGVTNATSGSIAFSADGVVDHFVCTLDGTTTDPCSSPFAFSGLADGTHTFSVHAVTPPPKPVDGPAATATWTVDTTKPVLSLPADLSVTATAGAASMTVTYTATASDDGKPLTPTCAPASGSSFPLGITTVTCTATDAAGNAASGTFVVTVVGGSPPSVTITGGPSGTVTSRAATLTFTASGGSTQCRLDGGGFAACGSPASFSGLDDGSHTFTVRVTGPTGTASASRSWSIDATPPALTLPSSPIVVEADGPNGGVATYSVSASDNGAAVVPSAIDCSPGSGARFPLGDTTVTCRVSDARGNTASGSFHVVVRDTTPPAINAPDVTLTATSTRGIRRSDPALAGYLHAVTATDLVSQPTLTNDAPALLPVGRTTIVFTAKDAAGNTATKRATVTVLRLGRHAAKPDLRPPANPTRVRAKAGDHRVSLTWRAARDVRYVTISMSRIGSRRPAAVVYRGARGSFVARRLRNDAAYRFVLVAWDRAGNRSRGVVVRATPIAQLLARPKAGARVTAPPLLRWAPVGRASYFNVQLWRGRVKVLSAWPTFARLQLARTWVYGGKRQSLAPGVYTWYVWPGLGSRAAARYGPMLGSRTFVVRPSPKNGL